MEKSSGDMKPDDLMRLSSLDGVYYGIVIRLDDGKLIYRPSALCADEICFEIMVFRFVYWLASVRRYKKQISSHSHSHSCALLFCTVLRIRACGLGAALQLELKQQDEQVNCSRCQSIPHLRTTSLLYQEPAVIWLISQELSVHLTLRTVLPKHKCIATSRYVKSRHWYFELLTFTSSRLTVRNSKVL